MTDVNAVVLVLVSGLLLGTWAVLLWGCAKGTSFVADLLAAILSFGMIAYLWSPAPMPLSWARSHGWVTTGAGELVVLLGTFATALVVVAVGRRAGLVERLSTWLSRG